MSRSNFSRTWAFRVVVLYVALFAVSVLTLLGFIYVTTVGFIDRQINATILADINGLSERYREHGLQGLVEVVSERIAADHTGESVYLLTDSEFQPVAGNLARWPDDLERQGRWATFTIERAQPPAPPPEQAEQPAPNADQAAPKPEAPQASQGDNPPAAAPPDNSIPDNRTPETPPAEAQAPAPAEAPTEPQPQAERPPGEGDDARAMSFLLSEGYHLLVGRNLRERENFENLIVQSLFWSLVMTAGLGLIGGLVMSRDMRRRLEAINATARQIIHGDLTQRMPVIGTDDEFDRLSGNLNDMLQQISRLMAAMREVSDNVAHDLRSPLTRLKTRLEVTLMSSEGEKPAQSAEAYRQAIELAVVETDKILGTFNALLSIAQAEAGSSKGEAERLDLRMLTADVAELYEPVAESAGLALTADLPVSVEIVGNRHLLFQAITNLVDNAIKYAGKQQSEEVTGKVTVSVARDGDQAVLVVGDTGPGIPEEDRERVLQRFVRLERSRTTPGNGLGLSLVTAVVGLHEGTLHLEDNEPGLRVVVRLPVAP